MGTFLNEGGRRYILLKGSNRIYLDKNRVYYCSEDACNINRMLQRHETKKVDLNYV